MKGMVERFTNDFIETRKKALHRFLNRIADHPILSSSEDFRIFLTAQAWVRHIHTSVTVTNYYKQLQTIQTMICNLNRNHDFFFFCLRKKIRPWLEKNVKCHRASK